MLNRKFKSSPNIVTRKILDEMLLVPIRGKQADMQKIMTLNGLGEFIWTRLDGDKTLNSIADDIVDNYDVENETAQADMIEFVDMLIEEDLVYEVV